MDDLTRKDLPSSNQSLLENLKSETKKWLKKAEEEIENAEATSENEKAILHNAQNYLKDCHFFMEKNDWIRAFEAVIYAYGIMDTVKRMKG